MSDLQNYYNIPVRIDDIERDEDLFKSQDPFNKSWDELKGLDGLNANFKRRESRLSKVDATPAYIDSAKARSTGLNGAQSKEINPGVVYRNGYGIFDIITPPYNLYELANYYDTSFANHACIDAKVENIVGLGYKFEISPRTMLRLETMEDTGNYDFENTIETMEVL